MSILQLSGEEYPSKVSAVFKDRWTVLVHASDHGELKRARNLLDKNADEIAESV